MWRPSTALLLFALGRWACCVLGAPPRLHPIVRQEPTAYEDCAGRNSGFADTWLPCGSCAARGECADECCRAETGENQFLVCKLGGCCIRKLEEPNDGDSVFAPEALTATTRTEDGVCTDLKPSESCDACAYLIPAGDVRRAPVCSSGYALPPSSEDFFGDLSCAGGTPETTRAPPTTVAGGAEVVSAAPSTTAAKDADQPESTEPVSAPLPVEKDDSDGGDDGDDGAKCFPGDARVHVEGMGSVPMRDLRIGDRVLVGPGTYSPVFMFTHRLADTSADFLEVSLVGGGALRLTAGHFVYANGGLVAARRLAPGDELALADGRAGSVAAVRRVRSAGLYNPQTLHGDVVVDGVVASTFTEAVAPAAAHAVLAPLRAAFRLLGASTSSLEAGGGGLHSLMPQGDTVV